jgi:PAS domain-containing protein
MLSSKGKIRLALFFVAAISMGTACISLLYMNNTVKRIVTIVEKDARMAQLGEDMSLKMLEARREEKNFIIYLDSSYVQSNRRILLEIEADIAEAGSISVEYKTELDSMKFYLAQYSTNVSLLVKTFQENPRVLETLQKQMVTYEDELKRLAKMGKIEPDSLRPWMSWLGDYTVSAGTRISTEKELVITNLKETSQRVQSLSQNMTTRARESVARGGSEAVRYGQRAQRNAVTIFLVTGLLLIYLVFYLPRRIFLPFQRIIRALGAISRGDTGFPFPEVDARDELGELSRAFQKAMSELRSYNILKTAKIIDAGKRLRRIMEEIDEAVLFISPDLRIDYANASAEKLFPSAAEAATKNLRDLPEIWAVIGAQLEEISRSGRVEYAPKTRKKDLKSRTISITPYFDKNGKLETAIVIVKRPSDV